MITDARYLEFTLSAERYALSVCGFCGHEDYIKTRDKHFAALVVSECSLLILKAGVAISESMPKSNRDNYVDVAYKVGRVMGATEYVALIKKHFEVE